MEEALEAEKPAFEPRETETQPDTVGDQVEPFDEEKETLEGFALTPEQRETRRLQKQPRIDHLKDATVQAPDGTVLPLFNVGDKVVVERYSELLNTHPWLDTRVLEVISIDDESGRVTCFDPDVKHRVFVGVNHPFTRIKLPPRRGNPLKAPDNAAKAGQPKPGKGGTVTDVGAGKGRPKGTKNRPKEVIAAEKRERATRQRLKEEARREKRFLKESGLKRVRKASKK